MTKQKQVYVCSHCGKTTPKWLGCCPGCSEWNTLVVQNISKKSTSGFQAQVTQLSRLDDIQVTHVERFVSGVHEWDRVAGGGLLPGSFCLVTGDPGIGKSTLLLAVAERIAQDNTVVYVSTEESLAQIKGRAERLGILDSTLLFSACVQLHDIIATIEQAKPALVIIDSIQHCYVNQSSLPGSIAQLKEAAFHLMRCAKEMNCSIVVTGHVTKEGVLAGPRMLEHMVDAVFYLQGEDRWQTRVLRCVKNRFGTVNELGFFSMHADGLHEVANINQHILDEISSCPGSALISYVEGSRPLLLEVQALTVPTKFGVAQRVVTGIDQKQVVLIAALLEKYLNIKLSAHDIFLKVSGGFSVKSSAADLGIALALLSSFFQMPLPEKSLVLGEVSLTGQVKAVSAGDMRAKEAHKFGLKQIICAANQKISTPLSVLKISTLYDLLRLFEL